MNEQLKQNEMKNSENRQRAFSFIWSDRTELTSRGSNRSTNCTVLLLTREIHGRTNGPLVGRFDPAISPGR